MLNRVWATEKQFQGARVRIEEHIYKDGTKHYSFINNFRTINIDSKAEAEKVIKMWKMAEATEEFRKAGWIA